MYLMYLLVIMMLIQMMLSVTHPITLSMFLIMISLSTGLLLFSMNISWFMYLLVLVFLGGVMILIIYMSTLAANEKFISNYTMFNLMPLVILLIFSFMMMNYYYCNYMLSESISSVMSIYEMSFYNFLVFLMIYLLLTMVSVVKLVKFETGPLIKRL
uniref:NADH dehydrogenase subunit 6 n=1 Tax=Undinula vulgaris TaxID=184747 RepID=A0A6B9D6P9_UNDVU|nr:NADH dehydrogenase subunit 6 [Undinula vulgaris]